jgi:hypothetical protein
VEVLNWGIVKHPMNWVILFLMVFIAMLALHLGLRMWQNSA